MTPQNQSRRNFVKQSTIAAISLAMASRKSEAGEEKKPRFKKAVKYHMVVDPSLSIAQKFELLKDLGFDGVEIRTRDKDATKLMNYWQRETGSNFRFMESLTATVQIFEQRLIFRKNWVERLYLSSQDESRKICPMTRTTKEWSNRLKENATYAEQQGIQLLVENVWNNFMFSPLEMARFIDEIKSPAVGVYFDLGNVVRFGYPDQWIRILGHRIGKLDIKEYSRDLQKNEGLWKGFNVEIGDGDVDFPACLKALEEIGYTGWGTAEVKGGNRERLAEVAERMNRVLNLS